MSAPQALNTLLEHAGTARDAAQAGQQRALQALQAARQQAVQLSDYRRDYAQRFGSPFQQRGQIALLQCYQGFMQRLDDAVAQQQRVVEQQATRAGEAQALLLAAELRVASVRKLIERRVAETGRAQARSEQKDSDELASRAAWLRLAGAAPGAALGGA